MNIFSTNLTNNSTINQEDVNYRLCKSQGAYCVHGYFGPVLSSVTNNDLKFKNQYYLSPGNRSDFAKISDVEFEQSEEERESFTPQSFLIGLFDK
jgi:hypothetical protein